MSARKTDVEVLAQALEVVLARVRCAEVHRQINGGRCVSCISWAKHVGVPTHLPRMAEALDEIRGVKP